jgi:hypothetical protein
MVNQNVQDALKKFQDNKNKECEKTQKQINEVREALNKYQSETESTISREISELKTKIKNIKEEVTNIWKTSEKKKQAETQNTVEVHYSRLEQVEDRISELNGKLEIKEKN